MRVFSRRALMSALIAGGGWALVAPAASGDILYATGFEPGVFLPGPLAGQDEFRANLGISANAAMVTSDSAYSGAQGVRISGADLDFLPDYGVYAGSYVHDVEAPEDAGVRAIESSMVTVSSMIKIDSTPEACTIGVSLLDRSGVNTLGFVGIDLATSETFVSNAIFEEVRGENYMYGEWAEFTGVFDLRTNTLEGYFNGVLIGEVPIVDLYESRGALPAIYSGAELAIISTEAIPDTIAEFDDFSVNLVPAPGTSAAMLCLIGSAAQRRRRG